MDYHVYSDTISMELFILYFWGYRSFLIPYDVFLSLKIVSIFANSAAPDEMPPYVVFHLAKVPVYMYL